MSSAPVVFDGVWKRFRRGERQDSLRDLIPYAVGRILGRSRADGDLKDKEFWAVRDVSFEVPAGEAFGIIGPNGAGKSTILKLLTRILRPTSGHCGVRGRTGALIEVASGFHPDLTGRENVYLQGAIMGMRRAEIARKFDEIVEFAGVHDFIDSPVKRYSSGMNARLGFSIAAHLDPKVLLIDEVLAVGDMAFQQKCLRRMEAFRDQGVALAFVSHNLHAVMHLCKNALLLDHGSVSRIGPASEVISAYGVSASGAHGGAKARTEFASVDVHVRGAGTRGIWTLRPGEVVQLDVDLQFHVGVELPAVGIVVRDMVLNRCVYDANSELVGIRPRRAGPGGRVSYQFAFVANLTRGVYAIEVNVHDLARQRVLALLCPVKQFTVVEEISYGGVANLFLTGSERSVAVGQDGDRCEHAEAV